MKCVHMACHQCEDESVRRLTEQRDEAMGENVKLRSLLQEAYVELNTIEAITVSPSDTDGLLDLVGRMRAALGEVAPRENAE